MLSRGRAGFSQLAAGADQAELEHILQSPFQIGNTRHGLAQLLHRKLAIEHEQKLSATWPEAKFVLF